MKPKALPEGIKSGFCSMNSGGRSHQGEMYHGLCKVDKPLTVSQSVGIVASYSYRETVKPKPSYQTFAVNQSLYLLTINLVSVLHNKERLQIGEML